MTRLPDWPARLNEFIRSARPRPFEWGRHDCCQFAGRAVAAMTGETPLAEYGPYSTRAQAMAELKRVTGSAQVSGAAVRALGQELPSKLYAQRGDVILASVEVSPLGLRPPVFEETLGVCLGRTVAVVDRAGGLAEIPLTDDRVRAAFRV